jgi:hypothetical protein
MPSSDAVKELTALNIQIGANETKGNAVARQWLDQVVAPALAFRRASGKFDGRAEFLAAVAPSDKRETTIESVDVYGGRAVVRCVVAMVSHTGEKRFDNLRLFVRHEGRWRLLGWANEPI